MVHGVPDWGVTNPPKTVYQVLEMGELAARLGSIDSFDRRGDVLFMDSFEDGLSHWESSGSGTGNKVSLSRNLARSGAYSARLQAGSSSLRRMRIQHDWPFAAWAPLGEEFSFNVNSDIESLELRFLVYTGGQVHFYAVLLAWATGTLSYLNSGAGWTPFAVGVGVMESATAFQTMKMVVDPTVPSYSHLLLNENSYDLSGIAPYIEANPQGPGFGMIVEVKGPGGTNPYVHVDDAIMTQNEPV